MLLTLPRITINTSCQCTTTFLSVLFMVRDSDKIATATPVSKSSCYASQALISYSMLPQSTFSCELHCTFEGRTAHTDRTLAFRIKPGFTLSRPRMSMIEITTFMFVLGFITLVRETALGFQEMQLFLDPTTGNVWSSYRTKVVILVVTAFTRLMVRLHDSPIPSAPLN